MIKTFDEVFANTMVQRTTDTTSEIIYDAQFLPMYHSSKDNKITILDLDKIDKYKRVE